MTGITLPYVQTYVPESFGEGAFPMIAVTRHTEDYEFHFKNICGALKLQLTGSAVVKEVKLTGNAAEKLSGKAIVYGFKDNLSPQIQMQEDASESVTLDCGSGVQLNEASPTAFILALPPVEFEKGFTVTITTADGKTGTLSTEKKNPVVRSHMLQMPVIKFETAGPVISDGDYYDEFGINHGPGTESEMRALMRNGNDFHFTGTTPYSEEVTSIYLPPKGRYNIDKERYQFEGENAYLWTSTTYSGWRTFVYGTESGIGYSGSDNGLLKMSVCCVQE